MSLITRFAHWLLRDETPAQQQTTMTLPETVEALNMNGATISGQNVTVESSKKIHTAYRCVNILSDDIAKLPFQTFASRAPGQIDRVKANSLAQNIAWLLEIQPNRWMTPFIFKKAIIMWLLNWGASYIWQPPRFGGRRNELFILRSNIVKPVFDLDGNLWYEVKWPGQDPDYLPDVEVLALLINSTDGITGNSVITHARETMGRQLGAHETQGKFYAQGLNPAGIMWMSGELNKDARKKIRDEYGEVMSGSNNAYRLAVMDNKVTKFEAITMRPIDMQFLESIEATDLEIANFYGVPGYKLNIGKQSYNSNEQQNLDYLNTTLDPYLVQWEQAAALRWLTEVEQNFMYMRFNRDALLRTDAKTRAETLAKRIETGQMSPNEARQIEDMPYYDGGDKKFVPSNWQSISSGAQVPVRNGGENASN